MCEFFGYYRKNKTEEVNYTLKIKLATSDKD